MKLQNAAVLKKNGVKTAICTDHPVIPIQYLALSAGLCVKAGLDYEEALRMLTIVPAEICGLSSRVGSIKKGKDADLIVVKGDLLDVYTSPSYVILNGKLIEKHD